MPLFIKVLTVVPVKTILLVFPLSPFKITKLPVAPAVRAVIEENVRLVLPPLAQVDCTVPSPEVNVSTPILWATPIPSLQLKVPVPVNVRAVPAMPFKLPVTIRVPAAMVVVPV